MFTVALKFTLKFVTPGTGVKTGIQPATGLGVIGESLFPRTRVFRLNAPHQAIVDDDLAAVVHEPIEHRGPRVRAARDEIRQTESASGVKSAHHIRMPVRE